MSSNNREDDYKDYIALIEEMAKKKEAEAAAKRLEAQKAEAEILEEKAKAETKETEAIFEMGETVVLSEIGETVKLSENQRTPDPIPIKKNTSPISVQTNTEPLPIQKIVEEKNVIENRAEQSEIEKKPENVVSKSKDEKDIFKKIIGWFNNLPKNKKIIIGVIAIILAIILFLTAVLGIFITQKMGLIGDNIKEDEYEEIIYTDEEFEDINIDIGSEGFKQSLIDWATQGNRNKMSSKNVINVLLVGADTTANAGNTDVMMLVSLNKETKQLKLVSFLRDSYLYIRGKDSSYCTKLNAAFSMGGPECLVETIENNYKIEIDNYVMVNFKSFIEIIDAMGGVTVDVKKYEADYNYTKFHISLPYGEDVTLNGQQALCFCRIRGCDADGDVSRTRRQRQVIEAIIDKVTNASVGDLNNYIDILLPYIDTGYGKAQILSLGVQAITGKWFNYERTQLQMPDEECRTSGSANAWIWVVDYQLAAHKLQQELYGKSNINLPEDRTTIIDIYNGVNYSGNISGSSSDGSYLITMKGENDTTEPKTEKVESTAPETTEEKTTEKREEKTTQKSPSKVPQATTERVTEQVTVAPETTAPETTEEKTTEEVTEVIETTTEEVTEATTQEVVETEAEKPEEEVPEEKPQEEPEQEAVEPEENNDVIEDEASTPLTPDEPEENQPEAEAEE